MHDDIDRFMDYLSYERNVSHNTVSSYCSDLNQFLTFLMEETDSEENRYGIDIVSHDNDIVVSSIGREEITAFLEFLYDNDYRKVSIERKIATLRSFFRYLVNNEIIKTNPALTVSYPKKEKKLLLPSKKKKEC